MNVSRHLKLRQICIVLACIVAIGVPAGSARGQEDAPALTIGSKAPDLDVKYWLSDNDGMFLHTTKIEDGHIYVIEFWATWCGPCIGAMPYIAELQEKFEDKKVQIISVSDEDLNTVENFLEQIVPGDKDRRTFGDLTNSYCLTTDPDKSVKEDYFRAAKRTGIPCAFVVGKTGLIEWIGHPMELGQPLERIVDDKWNRNEFLVEENKKREARKRAAVARKKLIGSLTEIQALANDDQPEKAVQLLDELMEDESLFEQKSALKSFRLKIMLDANLKSASSSLKQYTEENRNNGGLLNEIAWGIFQRHEANGDVDMELLRQAKKTAEYAVKAEPRSGAILDTLAHLIYVVDGDIDKAIEIQKDALQRADPRERRNLRAFLDQLEEEKITGKKAKKKKTTSDF